MSRYTDALSAFIAAEREHDREMHDDNGTRVELEKAARHLAQAGDVLERELRQMMREEATSVVRLDSLL